MHNILYYILLQILHVYGTCMYICALNLPRYVVVSREWSCSRRVVGSPGSTLLAIMLPCTMHTAAGWQLSAV